MYAHICKCLLQMDLWICDLLSLCGPNRVMIFEDASACVMQLIQCTTGYIIYPSDVLLGSCGLGQNVNQSHFLYCNIMCKSR